jgi:hypothetical protein
MTYDSPANYTPSVVGSEGTNKLSAHIKGIDNALGAVGSTDYYTEGTFAARPAASSVAESHHYYATDTEAHYISNGTDWVLISPIGSAITSSQDFVSTDGQTVFNLGFSYVTGANDLLVFSGGVHQRVGSGADYVETNSTTITFNTGREAGEIVAVYRVGTNVAGTVGLYTVITATAGQTAFDTGATYPVGTNALLVFKNGQLLTITTDYTETDSTTVTLTSGASGGDKLIFRVCYGETEAHSLTLHTDYNELMVPVQKRLMEGLEISNNSTNPNYQVDITDGVVGSDDGAAIMEVTSTLTVDLTASGANGLDTGSEAANTWYYLWLIMNTTTDTVAGLWSTSASNPTLPSGYDKKRLISAIRNNSGSNLYYIHQQDRKVRKWTYDTALSVGTATSWTAVNLGNFVPPSFAQYIDVLGYTGPNGGATYSSASYLHGGPPGNPSGLSFGTFAYDSGASAGLVNNNCWEVSLPALDAANPNVYYLVGHPNGFLNLYVTGYTLKI